MYIRFVVGSEDAHHKSLSGVINDPIVLALKPKLAPEERRHYEEIHNWLNRHLPVPPFKRSRWPKTAVVWFKDDAGEVVTRIWDLIAILRQQEIPVRMLKSKRPGRILYEDDYQVVVAQWGRL